jgi:hypothetical protein
MIFLSLFRFIFALVLVLTALVIRFISPMFMSNSTRNEESLNDDECEHCADKDQGDKVRIDFGTAICLRQDVDHGISNQSPTTQSIKQVDENLEALFRHALLQADNEDGSKHSNNGDTCSCHNAEAPSLGGGERLAFMIMVSLRVRDNNKDKCENNLVGHEF